MNKAIRIAGVNAILVLAACVLGIPGGANAATTYRVVDLGELPGGINGSFGQAVNGLGQVAGVSYASTGQRAFYWSSAAGMVNLGYLPGGSNGSQAFGINDQGAVVGYSGLPGSAIAAFRWTSAGGMVPLVLPMTSDTTAMSINNTGTAVGYGVTAQGSRAIVWDTQGNGQLLLGASQQWSEAVDINDSGHVVGNVAGTNGLTRPYYFTPQQVYDFSPLSGLNAARAYGMNDTGKFVGESFISSTTQSDNRATLWSLDGSSALNLGVLSGDTRSSATAINDQGQIIGYSFNQTSQRAFLWSATDGMLDLTTLIDASDPLKSSARLYFARDINDQGQIVGYGSFGGASHAFLLTPVPEPASGLLAAAGLLLTAMAARHRRAFRPRGFNG